MTCCFFFGPPKMAAEIELVHCFVNFSVLPHAAEIMSTYSGMKHVIEWQSLAVSDSIDPWKIF